MEEIFGNKSSFELPINVELVTSFVFNYIFVNHIAISKFSVQSNIDNKQLH